MATVYTERNLLCALLVLCLCFQMKCFNVTRRMNNTDLFSNMDEDAMVNCRPSSDSCKMYDGKPVFGHCFGPDSECCRLCECDTNEPIYLPHLKHCAHDHTVIDVLTAERQNTEISLSFASTPNHKPDCSERFVLPIIDLSHRGEWTFTLCRKKKRRRQRRQPGKRKGSDDDGSGDGSDGDGDSEDDSERHQATEMPKQGSSPEMALVPTQSVPSSTLSDSTMQPASDNSISTTSTSLANCCPEKLMEFEDGSKDYECKLDHQRCEFFEDGMWKKPNSHSWFKIKDKKNIFSVKKFQLKWEAVPDARHSGFIMSLGIKCRGKKKPRKLSAREINSYLILRTNGTREVWSFVVPKNTTTKQGRDVRSSVVPTTTTAKQGQGDKHIDDKTKVDILLIVLAIVGGLLVVAVCIIVFLVATKKKSSPKIVRTERRGDGSANPTYERGPDSSIKFTYPEEFSSENGGQTYQPLVQNTRQVQPAYATLNREETYKGTEKLSASNGNYQEPSLSPLKGVYEKPEALDPDPPYQVLDVVRPRPPVHRKLKRLCKVEEEKEDKKTSNKAEPLYDVLEPEKEGDSLQPRGVEIYV